jgi:hypothetical protein
MKTEKPDIYEIASLVDVAFHFVSMLIPYLEILEKTNNNAKNKEELSLSAAPLLGAFGVDFDKKEREWRIIRKRGEALVNLVKTLKETELERQQNSTFVNEREQIIEMLGL